MKRILLTIVAIGLFVLGVNSFSFANQIIFTHTGSGAGSIGGTDFETTDFTITAIGNTNDRQSYSGGFFIDHLSSSIVISGVGVFDFITGTQTFVYNPVGRVGFTRAGLLLDLYDGPIDSSLTTWDMLSSIGPLGGTTQLFQWSDIDVITSGGILLFTDQDGISGTFQAEVAPVPEPATMLLLGTGLVGVAGAARRRKKNQA